MTRHLLAALLALTAIVAAPHARGIAIDPFYSGNYAFTDLGPVSGLPPAYGGLTFKPGDANRVWIGGNANDAPGLIYEVGVVRGGDGHITGFSGAATPLGTFGAYNDGGVIVGPGGVLFLARWPVNEIGQVLPGGIAEYRVDTGPSIGIPTTDSIAAMNFVPPGFGGAGSMKVVTWADGRWFDVAYSPDGGGGFNLAATQIDLDLGLGGVQTLPGGPEGFVYIPGGNPDFAVNSMLLAEFSSGIVSSYELDADGNPILSSRREFVTGLDGAEGAAVDPLTGDFLFSTFGTAEDRVIAVRGFTDVAPPIDIPLPGTLLLLAAGLAVLGWSRRS